jgi:hypothetical protein
MMRKLITVLLAAAFTIGCGQAEPDQRICDDAPRAQRAIQNANLRPDFTQELLDDIAERATEAGCPGYEERDDEDG